MDVQILPLVPNAILPEPARASTHDRVPSGYSLKRQSVPFSAANALGLLVLSPIDFGICAPDDVPAGALAFRSPHDPAGDIDARMFYVLDNPACRFERNAFTIDPIPCVDAEGRPSMVDSKPGLSFFAEPDQQSLFKIRLPYILRTPREVDSLFTAAVNRATPLGVVSKLLETDWYPHPVNLVVRKPQFGVLHIAAGDVLAQIFLVARAAHRPRIDVIAETSEGAQAMHADRIRWLARPIDNVHPYNRLARSRHGRIKD